MQNGKGSNRRPEAQCGKYTQNYDDINWSRSSSNLIERAVTWLTNKKKSKQVTDSEEDLNNTQKGEK